MNIDNKRIATVKISLDDTIKQAPENITRNAVAVEGKIRPATISDLCNGKSKTISFDVLGRIVNALNTLDESGKLYEVQDVIKIEY